MSVGKDSRLELKIKDIRRITNTRWTDDAARMCLLSRQRGENSWSRLWPEFDIDIIHFLLVLHNTFVSLAASSVHLVFVILLISLIFNSRLLSFPTDFDQNLV